MTQTQLNNWLYYLQCKYSTWATSFNNSLSYGTCIDSFIENNITISNLFGPLHRYVPFTSTVTNAFSITIAEVITPANVSIAFTLDGYTITYTGVNDTESILTYIVAEINTNVPTYTTIVDGSTIYLYSYDTGESFSIPTITYSDTTLGLEEESLVISTDTLEEDLDILLNKWNCLTLEEVCAIKNKLNSLLGNCNC